MGKSILISLGLAALAMVVGCSKPAATFTDAAGNKVSASADGTKAEYTDSSGKTSTVETSKDGTSMTVKNSDGTTASMGGSVSETDIGLPFYPGSTEKAGGSFKADTTEETGAISVRTTNDDPAKVVDFYKSKVKQANVSSYTANGAETHMLTGTLDSGATVTVTAIRDTGKTETTLSVSSSLKKKK